MCNEPLPDSYIKKLCQSCIDYTLQQESSVRMKEIRLMIREELQSLGGSPAVNIERKTRRAPSPAAETSAESGEVDSDISQKSGSSDDEDYNVCFPTDSVNNLIKSVRGTMGVSESKEPQTPQDVMFAGLSQRKGHVFPVNQAIKDLIKREWSKGQKRFVPVSSAREVSGVHGKSGNNRSEERSGKTMQGLRWLSDASIDVTPLKMDIILLLFRLKKIFCSILSLCSMAWNPFFWYKFTWRLFLLLSEEIMSTQTFGPKSSTKENTHMLFTKQDSDDDDLLDELKSIQDINTSSISRLNKFQEKIDNLETDLSGEKELWRARFHELSQDQQTLKEQQQKYVHFEDVRRSDNFMPQYADATDGIVESNVDVNDSLHRRLGDQVKSAYDRNWTLLNECHGLEGLSSLKYSSLPSACPCVFFPECTNAEKASKCFRVFVPRSPIDLKFGSRVKVLLPSGQVGTGVVYKVGQLPGKDEFQVAVDLESPECWQQLHKFKAQCKFHRNYIHHYSSTLLQEGCDPPSGVVVPFSKVLMVWK
ncbi:uncharacterized protein LOC143817695 [Ranitomeya variabilis]|uniref:uncharacterized protein LOC143817695 n=1 Tax=Ranitomeya variabilis TaxID=490064 RepID=UPI0040573CED